MDRNEKRINGVAKLIAGLCVAILIASQFNVAGVKAKEIDETPIRHVHSYSSHYSSGSHYGMSFTHYFTGDAGTQMPCYATAEHYYFYARCSCGAISSGITCEHLYYIAHPGKPGANTYGACGAGNVYMPLPNDLPIE